MQSKLHSIRLVFVMVFAAMASVSASASWFSDTRGIMGTEVSVTLWHEQSQHAQRAMTMVMDEMRRIDSTFSPYKPTSELSKVNRSAFAKPQKVSDELEFLIDKSLYFSRISNGAFDITFASLARYYDYRAEIQPTKEQIQQAKPAFNYQWLRLDARRSELGFEHEHVQIDLGGIAKGYAVDRAITILQELGIKHASVSAGGDSRVIGDRRGRPWVIGIKNPRIDASEQDQAAIRLPLSDVAVSTSGDYERYFIDEKTGARHHHILNPSTGRSASEVMSVTILGDRGVDTDPLSTAVFVMGVDSGLNLVNLLPSFDAIIIDIQGKVHYSDGLSAGSSN